VKANDKGVPEDEMMLAAALAAARARKLTFFVGQRFWPDKKSAVSCCALGALELAGILNDTAQTPTELMDVWRGNDSPYGPFWGQFGDHGESLGWAFRCAMTQDDE
jgi:hypothetical protein